MKHADDTVDLPSEARRRKLSGDEESRLEALLEGSPEEKVLYRAGVAFDRDSSARKGDDILIGRLASRAAQQFGTEDPASVSPSSRPPKRRRPFVVLLVAALVIAGGAAAAGGVVRLVGTVQSKHDLSSSGASVPTAPPEAKLTPRGAPPAPSVVASAPEELRAPAAVEPAPPSASPVVASSKPVSTEPADAAALFGDANRKRVAGDTAGALARYAELAQRFPQSAEANLAELSLGKLYLAAGNAARALESFRRAGAAGGDLGSEALWGQASALRALGQTRDERATLERLLTEYPTGAYARAARKRLGTSAP